jgi:hypothetical protein
MRSPETDSGSSRRVLWIVVITLVVSITVGVLFVAALMAIAWSARWRTISSSVHDHRWWLALAAVVAVTILVLLLLNKFLQRPWGAPWRVNILAAADALHYELDALPAGVTPEEQAFRGSVGNAVEHHLKGLGCQVDSCKVRVERATPRRFETPDQQLATVEQALLGRRGPGQPILRVGPAESGTWVSRGGADAGCAAAAGTASPTPAGIPPPHRPPPRP